MGRFKNQISKVSRNQHGVASIFVVMILMTILALISIGFSHLMNRELRQSLDRQLSTEAYFAAESGVNDAKIYLANGGTDSAGCASPTDTARSFVNGGDISGDGSVNVCGGGVRAGGDEARDAGRSVCSGDFR